MKNYVDEIRERDIEAGKRVAKRLAEIMKDNPRMSDKDREDLLDKLMEEEGLDKDSDILVPKI